MFMAGLYTNAPTQNANDVLNSTGDKKMEVRVTGDKLSTRRFKRMWIEGMAINSSSSELSSQAEDMANFSNMLKLKLAHGDIFTIAKNSTTITVSLNSVEIGKINNPTFFNVLVRTWIGNVPLSSTFRDNLLAGGNVSPEKLAQFKALQPTPSRVAIVQEAMKIVRENEEEKDEKTETIGAATVVTPPLAVATNDVTTDKKDTKPKATPTPTPTPKKSTPTPKPEKKNTPDVLDTPQQAVLDESIFEEEDDTEFTAEKLLIEQLYYSRLANYTQKYARYPRVARERGTEGTILLRVTINREGKVTSSEVLEQTDSYSLNNEAKKAVKRANPYPAVPDEIQGDEFSFTFRLTFSLQGH